MELTKKDIVDFITVIRVNFDGAYKTTNETDELALINSWYNLLFNYPKEIVLKAFNLTLREAEFAPRIGTIVKEIEKICAVQDKSEEMLWAELISVLYKVNDDLWRVGFTSIESNGRTQGENAKERIHATFESLSPEIREYLQNTSELISLSQKDEKMLGYEKNAFIKAIPGIKARLKTRAELSDLFPELKKLLVKR